MPISNIDTSDRKVNREFLQFLLDYDSETGLFRWKNSYWSKSNGKIAGNYTNKYVKIMIEYESYAAHRLAWLYYYGEPVPNEIDHKDRNPHNNAISNLRAATRPQNRSNSKLDARNTTGYKGVYFHKASKRYFAQIVLNGKLIKRYCNSLEEAIKIRQNMFESIQGEFAHHG